MQNAIELKQTRWQAVPLRSQANASVFVAVVVLCLLVSAFTASWLPLQVSIVTVFLFAGPHNWFEFRYFLMRLPLRFGKSRTFFLTAFAGIGLLTITYVALPIVYRMESGPAEAWSVLAGRLEHFDAVVLARTACGCRPNRRRRRLVVDSASAAFSGGSELVGAGVF
jgi:hypothetical protein